MISPGYANTLLITWNISDARISMRFIVPALGLLVLAPVYAQSISAGSGTIRGTVLDPSGSTIPNAAVEIQNPVSRYDRSAKSDGQGNFEFDNVPYNNYHLSASSTGFQGSEQDVN